MNIAIIQPVVPVYREDFYRELQKYANVDVYVFKDPKLVIKEQTKISSFQVKHISNKQLKGFVFYNPLPLLSKKYDVLVLMQTISHITTWLLLLTQFIHRKKIVLWGQGITMSKYEEEQLKPNFLRKIQIKMAKGLWLYMEKEYHLWHKWLPKLPMNALNNTVSKADYIANIDIYSSKKKLKEKYGIIQEKVIIFCARFETSPRRPELLIEAIQKLNPKEFAFIIIGDGRDKPDFSKYKNVFEFGSVYNQDKKTELFTMADIYFQPGWVGLSIVEAMAYAKPICTFIRSKETMQCVEYSYIEDGMNGLIFKNMEECISKFNQIGLDAFHKMGENARKLVKNKLTPQNMASNAWSVLKSL